TIKQLESKDGDVFTYQPTNTLIISDTGNNLFRLEQIIKQLDVASGDEEIQLVSVNYAVASQLAEKLIAIYDIKAGQRPTSPPPRAAPSPSGMTPASPGDGPEVRVSKILFDDRTNKLIVVATPRSFRELTEIIRKLDVPVADDGKINVYRLENSDAEQIAGTLSNLAQGRTGQKTPGGAKGGQQAAELFSGEVKVMADKTSNSLVIIANNNDFKNLVGVIKKLDIRRRQVFVEAVIMEVTLDKSTDIGVALSGGAGLDLNGTKFPLMSATVLGGLNSLVMDPSTLAQMGGFLTGVQGPAVEGVTIGNSKIPLPSFGAILRAIQTNSDVNVLSTPNLLTTDNEEAEILVGQNIPYQSGFTSAVGGSNINSFNPIISIQRMDVAIKLKIKPQINNSDFVKLNIEEEVSDVAGTDPLLGPTTSKRSTKSVVVVKDQQTVATGGLIKDNQTINTTKVPFLGDIPILGWFFRQKTTKTTKTNLIFFLTPYIIKDQDDFRKIFDRKMKERQEFVQRFYGATKEYAIYIDYQKKHGPISEINAVMDGEMQRAENDGPGVQGETIVLPGSRSAAQQQAKQAAQPAAAPAPEAVPVAPPPPVPQGMGGIQIPPAPAPAPAPGSVAAPDVAPSPPPKVEEKLEVH
ncbi:MAG: type II secretion system secretin GspD, partial [Myxococcota bacterium]